MTTSIHSRRLAFGSLDPSARERFDGVALMVVGALVTLFCLRSYIGHHIEALDFRSEYWAAGAQVIHGVSPYTWSAHQADPLIAFAYPPLSGLLFVPFALLSRTAAATIFAALCIASPLLSLRVLGVCDRRVYGLVLVWSPVLTAWQTANLTLPLTLGIAVLWRYRDRPVVVGALTAVLISLKPVMFPLALWILVTRRFAAAGWGLLVGTAINAVAWSIIGFNLIGSYLRETDGVTRYFHRLGYSAQSIALRCGLGDLSGLVVIAICVGLLVVIVRLRRRDASVFALTVVMGLAASPLVWNHYFAFMLVPVAIAFPRFNRVWLAPLLLFFCAPLASAWWEPWLFWIVTLYVIKEILSRNAKNPRESTQTVMEATGGP